MRLERSVGWRGDCDPGGPGTLVQLLGEESVPSE